MTQKQATTMSPLDFVAVLLVVLIWGFNFVPSEIALRDFTPYQLGAARFLLVSIPLVFFIARPALPIKLLIAYGITQGVGQFSLLYLALKFGMTASLASVLLQTQLFVTAIFAAAMLGETISKPLLAGMLVAAAGLVCFGVSVLGDAQSEDVTLFGVLCSIAASVMWAASNIVVRQAQATGIDYSPISLLVWGSLVSAIGFCILTVLFDDPSSHWQWLQASLLSWLSLLYLAILSTGVAYGLWTMLLTKHQASQVAPFSLGVPVVGLISGIALLQETLDALQWIGTVLLMSALVFVVFSSRWRATKKYAR